MDELKSVHDSEDGDQKGGGEIEAPDNEYGVITKYDADAQSAVTFLTEATSALVACNPSSLGTIASSKLELQLNFLAKELEIEKKRREDLQSQVDIMHEAL